MNHPFAETIAQVRSMSAEHQLRLAYCILSGPVGDLITGEEAAEHGIYDAEDGLLSLIIDRGGEIEDIIP